MYASIDHRLRENGFDAMFQSLCHNPFKSTLELSYFQVYRYIFLKPNLISRSNLLLLHILCLVIPGKSIRPLYFRYNGSNSQQEINVNPGLIREQNTVRLKSDLVQV